MSAFSTLICFITWTVILVNCEVMKDGVFLTNLQLQRLIEENVLRKADIARVPCIRRSRRCLVQSIKERGWKNQKKLNEILNKILNIRNENKFINQVIKLMIADNSELLHEARNDGEFFNPPDLLKLHNTTSKPSSVTKEKRSKIPINFDFLNTYDNLNDFNEEFPSHANLNSETKDEMTDEEIGSYFSDDERKFVDDTIKKTVISNLEHSEEYDADNTKSENNNYSEGVEASEGSEFGEKRTEILNKREQLEANDYIEENDERIDNDEFDRKSETYASEKTVNGMKKSNVEAPYDNPQPGSYMQYDISTDERIPDGNFIGNTETSNEQINGETVGGYNENVVETFSNNPYEQGQMYMNTGIENSRGFLQPDQMYIGTQANPTSVEDLQYTALKYPTRKTTTVSKKKRRKHNKKYKSKNSLRKSETPISNETPQTRENALRKFKEEAYKHMEQMSQIDIKPKKADKSKKQKKHAKKKKAKKMNKKKSKFQNEEIQQKGETSNNEETEKNLEGEKDQGDLQDPYSNESEDAQSEEADFEQSLASLESGWGLEKYVDKENIQRVNENDEPAESERRSKKRSKKSKKNKKRSKHKMSHSKHEVFPAYEDGNVFTADSGSKMDEYNESYDQENSDLYNVEYSQPESDLQDQSSTYTTQPQTTTIRHNSSPSIGLNSIEMPDPTEVGQIKATRVCKPGVPKPFHSGKPNCLIIGDSIALGYSYSVAAALSNTCQVQLAPSSKAGVALDSRYGLQCLNMFLSTIKLLPTYYDVILFNFGLHDIDYLDRYPEEFHSKEEYKKNLRKIKKRLQKTGATLGFVLSTPVTFNASKDRTIKEYNHAAKEVIGEDKSHKIYSVNLHKIVTKECGATPFENCYMMKKPHDVHYGVTGSIMLGKRVATFIKFLLKKRSQQQLGHPPPVLLDFARNATTCGNSGTRCPRGYTCMRNIVSRTGQACCGIPNGIDCGDSWHCCPPGTKCHPDCKDTLCTCIK